MVSEAKTDFSRKMAVERRSVRFATIYDALSIIVKILYVLGYSGFYQKGPRFVTSTGMLIYNIVMTSVVISLMVLGIYFKLTYREHMQFFREMDRLLISIVLLELTITTLSFGTNVFGMVSNRERHIQLIDLIDQLDRCAMREFGAEMGYEKLAFKTILVLSVFFVYEVVVTISAVSHWTKGDLGTVTVVACCYSLIIAGMHMTTYGFMTMADVMRIRFRLLQKLLQPEYLRKHFANEDVRASKLREAVKIYRGLYDVIDGLNHVYGVCMVSCLAHDFTLTTSQLYLMFGRSSNIWSDGNLRVFVGVLATLVPPAYKMVMMPVYASLSITEGNKCMKAIKLMDDAFPGDDRVRQIVGAALRWHSHNKVEYKIGHINCNKGMMASMMSGLLNYVIVLIQFQLQEEVVNKDKPKDI